MSAPAALPWIRPWLISAHSDSKFLRKPVRLFPGYSFLLTPNLSLLLEALDGINGGLMNAAVVTYAASQVVPELVTTVRGILGCFLFGGGKWSEPHSRTGAHALMIWVGPHKPEKRCRQLCQVPSITALWQLCSPFHEFTQYNYVPPCRHLTPSADICPCGPQVERSASSSGGTW